MTTPKASEVEQFLSAYASHWALPCGDLGQVFHPEGRLLVPGAEAPYSVALAGEFVAGVKARIPDIALRLLRWAERDGDVFTEWEMSGTLAGQRVSWRGINRNRLRGARSIDAVSYWDRLGLLEQLGASPRVDLATALAQLERDA